MYPSERDAVGGLFVRELAEALAKKGVDVRVVHVVTRLVWPFALLKRRSGLVPGVAAAGPVPVLRHVVAGGPAALGVAGYARRLGAGLAEAMARAWPDFHPDIVHAHTLVPGALAAQSLAATLRRPLVATVHGADARIWLRRARPRQLILAASRRGLPVVCVSETIQQALAAAGVPPGVLRVVHNGMDLAKIHSGANPLAPRYARKTVVLGVGNLKPTKGFDVFIEAIAEARKTHPDLLGVIVGDGPERRRLERLARRRNLADSVSFVGAQPPAVTMQYMDLCTLFCLPSWSEGFGVSYLEALAHGKPVVAVAGQGFAAVVRGSETGLLVPPRDGPATAAAICRLVDGAEERTAMGVRGRRLVAERFSWARCGDETIAVYRDCLAGSANFKIAHVDFTVDDSVDRKLERMGDVAWQRRLPLEWVVFSATSPPGKHAHRIVYRLPGSCLGSALAAKVQWPFRLRLAARRLENKGYDVVVLRYPKLPVGWRSFLRRVGVPVVTEHHADEPAEIRGSGSLWRKLAAAHEAKEQKEFLRHVDGIIGVTPEITARIQALAPRARAATISNGVDVAAVPFTGFAPFDGHTLRLVAVASRFVPSHGVDRLLAGIQAYRGTVGIELLLVGCVPDDLKTSIGRCALCPGVLCRCPGPVYGPGLDAYFAAANLAVASLALSRKGLRQGCTLKVREYLARGIPFVYGHDDPDVPEPCGYALRLEDDGRAVDVQRLVDFAQTTAQAPGLAVQMRQYALARLDWSRKLGALVEFAAALHRPGFCPQAAGRA